MKRNLLNLLLAALLFAGGVPCAGAADEAAPAADDIAQLIEQLGSSEYIARQRAERELLRLGSEAFDALAAAENHVDLEIAARAGYLARRITIDWTREDDPAEVKRIMSGYEAADDESRLERVQQLLRLPDGQGIPALARIVRFEKSPLLAKQAAILWLDADDANPAYWQRHRQTIKRLLSVSSRPAAQWVRTQLQGAAEPADALAAWDQLLADEQQTLATMPDATTRHAVLALLRRKVALLKQLNRNEQAVATMIEMIDLEDGNSETLTELVDWLVEQQAWMVIDQVAERFEPQFRDDWALLYLLAEARAAQGQVAASEELAERAFHLGPNDPARHLRAAFHLQKRGVYDWADREYRHVMALGPQGSRTAMFATVWLAEMLHDEGDDKAAADVLHELVQAMEKDASILHGLQRIGREVGATRSRMEYFFALYAAEQGDFDQQKKHLDRAITHDPTDADVLIAMYHLPNTTPEYQAETVERIERAAAEFDAMVEEFPDDPVGYNQYAWLVGNTTGDLDKAIRYSHRSLELKPNTAGYLDTLAHAYYTKGDYASAVRYQEEAVQLDPHTGLIRRPLAKFRAALEKAKSEQNAASEPPPEQE